MRTTVIAVVLVLVFAVAAFATGAFQKTFQSNYKPKSNTELTKAKCAACHVKGDNKKLNLYGEALKGKPAKASSLKRAEKFDSDKDGILNIDEIKSGTLPGDPVSKPKVADRDPVCKMKVATCHEPPGGKSTYKGITYYFCNKDCKIAFDKNPEKYVGGSK